MYKHVFKALLAVTFIGFSTLSNATIILSGDGNIGNAINGSSGATINPNNGLWFTNILGNGTTTLIQSQNIDSSLDNSADAINAHYNGLSGVSSSIFNALITDNILASVDLFISILPSNAYSASEVSAIQSFIGSGGTLFLIGETANFNPENTRINNLLVSLGSDLRLGQDRLDGGFTTTTNVDSNPFNNGVSSFTHAFSNSVSGGTTLIRALNGQAIIATDAITAPIPEPSSLLLVGLALCGLGISRKKGA